jgi:large subunit ribosomal protein L19
MASRLAKLEKFEKSFSRKDIPSFEIGDTIKMKIKVQEADKVRLHSWEGTVIAKRGKGVSANFTVRKVAFGEGVEKIFPINSPVIDSLKVVATSNVGRAKLFYLRDKTGKKARVTTEMVRDEKVAAVAA